MALDVRQAEAARRFLASLADVPWLAGAGTPSARYRVAPGLVAAWDDWNGSMLAVWRPATTRLEASARQAMGDSGIDEVFGRVAESAARPVLAGLDAYYGRPRPETDDTQCGADESLRHELLDAILRDTAWCAIECVLGEPGFFTRAMDVYREGRWPCGWEGAYPAGGFVVL